MAPVRLWVFVGPVLNKIRINPSCFHDPAQVITCQAKTGAGWARNATSGAQWVVRRRKQSPRLWVVESLMDRRVTIGAEEA